MQLLDKGKAKQPVTVRLAMWSARHRWSVVSVWFVVCLGIFICSLVIGGTKTEMSSSSNGLSRTESRRANQIFRENGTVEASQDLVIVVTHPSLKVTDPKYRGDVTEMLARLLAIRYTDANGEAKPVFAQLPNPFFVPPSFGLISPDQTSLRLVGKIMGVSSEVKKKLVPVKPVLDEIKNKYKDYQINVWNNSIFNEQLNESINSDLDGALQVTLPLTFAILLIAFGAVVASIVPLVLAITALLADFGLVSFYSQFISPVSSYATQLVVLIGLAVAVDYSLFMITRFRTERRHGREKMAALEIASSTAGRAVFFSGLTVAISIAGLFLIDDDLFKSMALGTIWVVLISVVGSLTFLPAVIAILGNRLNWGRIPFIKEKDEGTGFWSKLVNFVMNRPIVLGGLVILFLLTLAYPMLHLRLGSADISSFPDKLDGVQAISRLNEKWPQGSNLKLAVTVTQYDQEQTKVAIEKLKISALQIKGLSEPVNITPSSNGKVASVSFTMSGKGNDQANYDIVSKMRNETIPAAFSNAGGSKAYVTGDAAYTLDEVGMYAGAMPVIFAFVLGLSFLLLLLAFHSIVIPIKAILLNLLSTGASYGVLVLVFQDGWFGGLLGIKPTGTIESWVPVFIFTILFGLSMDYHLFILTRIKEAKDRGATSNEAVAKGISITSGTITGAAAIMVGVFGVFVTLQLVIIRQIGLGLAVAVFIDATLIRCVLLPATMKLLGDWNWWIPKFLDWLPHITIEGEADDEEKSVTPEPTPKQQDEMVA